MSYALRTVGLHKYFYESTGRVTDFLLRRKRIVRAVDGVDLEVLKNETLGLVGESGCGKSTLGRTVVRLYEPTAGQLFVNGDDISHRASSQLKQFRRQAQIVFQNPYSSLNPRRRIRDIIQEPMEFHGLLTGPSHVRGLLQEVGLEPEIAARYPHQLSGGQRQRVAIARAIAVDPSFLVCDEITSALDVSIQAQIIRLLQRLQAERGLSYLFISHDLSVVKTLAHRIAVMYLGKIVEEAPADQLFENPLHPYTQSLMASIPLVNHRAEWNPPQLKGDPPSAVFIPSGCRFHPRCPVAFERCPVEEPQLRDFGGHQVACHLADKWVATPG